MSCTLVAIDPGLTGALAFFDGGMAIGVEDMPLMQRGKLCWVDGHQVSQLLHDYDCGTDTYVVCERVASMPRQGVSSTFQFGVAMGSILGALGGEGHREVELMTPKVWKGLLGLHKKDKGVALDMARERFPSMGGRLLRKKDHNRAEALLLGHAFLTKQTLVKR